MRFTPKSKEELDADGLMPKGEYDATVLVAEETTSKSSGKPMFKLKLGVFHGAREQWVYDYIVCDTYKLPNIARACGLFDRYESGELEADELQGRDIRVRIGIEPADGDHPAKNKVADYLFEKVAPREEKRAAEHARIASGEPRKPTKQEDPKDDIPFN